MKLSNISINPYPPPWQDFLTAKHSNVPHHNILTALNNFLQRHPKGYFTIIGPPGCGKSAFVANLVGKWRDGEIITLFYPVELNPDPEQFLPALHNLLPGFNNTSLSLLLQQLSQQLQSQQKLIIAIDGLNKFNYHRQPPGSNILYLPRYLPNGIYFLLTRRPFPPGKSGLLTETPCGNWEMGRWGDGGREYYQQYWREMQQMINSPLALEVKQILASHSEGLTLNQLALELQEDEFDIEEVLEKWYEFLLVNKEGVYRFYHHNFATWLKSH